VIVLNGGVQELVEEARELFFIFVCVDPFKPVEKLSGTSTRLNPGYQPIGRCLEL